MKSLYLKQLVFLIFFALLAMPPLTAFTQEKKPNIVMLMTDDTGWNDFARILAAVRRWATRPNVNRITREGAVFSNWYGQASCTAGRASFITGRIPIRTALSIVIGPGDRITCAMRRRPSRNSSRKTDTRPTSRGNGTLVMCRSYPTEHGFDEMKHFAAYYAGVYAYENTASNFHPWFPSFNPDFMKAYNDIVNLGEWEGVAGQPAKRVGSINYDSLAEFDVRQTNSAVEYIQSHAKGDKPFFMDVNFIKMHNPTNPAPAFRGRSHLGNYSDSLMEMDADIGQIMDALRAHAPNTIVILTADNGAWLDAYPDAGTTPFRGEKGSPYEGGWRVPGIMWWPGHIAAGATYHEMMSNMDAWATLAGMTGLTPPPREWVGNDGKPIYFDSVDNSAYILGKAPHSARTSWVYINGEHYAGVRVDIGGDPKEPWLRIAWKYLNTAKDSWLGPTQDLGAIGALYDLTMDPYEKYDMIFNGAAPSRIMTTSPGRYAGQDNGWTGALITPVIVEFDKSIMKFPNIPRFVGGASTDLEPNLQHPENPSALERRNRKNARLRHG